MLPFPSDASFINLSFPINNLPSVEISGALPCLNNLTLSFGYPKKRSTRLY